MKPLIFSSLLLVFGPCLFAQTPQPQFSFLDKSGTTGHYLVVSGKTLGPYKEITKITQSTSGTEGIFVVTRRDKNYIVFQGQETGPLATGFDPGTVYVSDDGQVWAVEATQFSGDDSSDNQAQLWVNGKLLGSYISISDFEYAEKGGTWIAAVQQGEDKFEVLLEGRSQGTFASVDRVWVTPDGKYWGFVATDDAGKTRVVTQDQTYDDVKNTNFQMMSARDAHWSYGFKEGEDKEIIVVDGKEYPGYLNFSGLTTSTSGRHWGFGADKMSDSGDIPVVVVDGVEYIGEDLETAALGSQEMFSWTVKDGSKVTIQVLTFS